MNWKLLFILSLFGLAMAFATVSLIPSKIEPTIWLLIFVTCAWFIAKNTNRAYFLHGFILSLINCIFVVGVHVICYHTYILNHHDMAQINAKMPLSTHPRLMMILLGPLFGIAFGVVQGLFSYIAGKLVKK